MATDIKYGETRDLVFVPVIDDVPQTGQTVEVLIRRLSDGYSWTGSAFASGDNWLTMSEVLSTGQYTYSITFPSSDTDIQALYRVTALEIFGAEDIYVRDIPELTDITGAISTSETNIIAEIDANETLINNIITLIGTPATGTISGDIAAVLAAVLGIQNNTRFTAAVPVYMQKPDTGDLPYRHAANLYDTSGNMEDPDNSEILVRVLQTDGTPITANLYKEAALTNPLDDPTDTVNFPPANGWRAMERLGVGLYDYFYKVNDSETEEELTVEFGWDESGSLLYQYRKTEISDTRGDLSQILQNTIDILEDTGTTIPAQINDQTAILKGLIRLVCFPEWMYVPFGRSRINVTGGITAIDTEIPVLDATAFPTDGLVKIENEYIVYTGITDSKLQVTTRGAYGTTPAAHNNNVVVDRSVVFPVKLMVHDNENNMVDADSLPTLSIEDWKGTTELAPTAMTKIGTGIYNYDYIIDRGAIPENKNFIFSATVNSITSVRHLRTGVNNEPASEISLGQFAGGNGEFVCDQDGWYDSDGIFTAWGDVLAGYVRDVDTGAPLDDAYVTAYLYVNGETLYNGRPPAQSRTRVNGTWLMYLDSGTYTFVIEKDGFRIVADGVINRTIP